MVIAAVDRGCPGPLAASRSRRERTPTSAEVVQGTGPARLAEDERAGDQQLGVRIRVSAGSSGRSATVT